MRILLVEDDPSISVPLAEGLTREGFEVHGRRHRRRGAGRAAGRPGAARSRACPTWRAGWCARTAGPSAVPIIVVTARGEEIDRVMLLELGADDYVVKPFGLPRAGRPDPSGAAAHFRRGAGVDRGRDRGRRAARSTSGRGPCSSTAQPVALTPKEYDLLVCLAVDPVRVRGREQLIHDVWDEHWWGSTKTLDVHVASLRKKLRPELIETVRSVGYRIVDLAPRRVMTRRLLAQLPRRHRRGAAAARDPAGRCSTRSVSSSGSPPASSATPA